MPLQIIRNDITAMAVDAIVNAANSSLLGGGGVDGAIHAAAGTELLAECRGLGGCPTGQAKITGGYRLPARYVIHTVGPIWRDGKHGERDALESCYRESLRLAEEHGCETVAFPLISAGAYGYPKDEALAVATGTIRDFLQDHEMQVYLVVYDRRSFVLSRALAEDIAEFIDQRYVEDHPASSNRRDIYYEMSFGAATMAPTAPTPAAAAAPAAQKAEVPSQKKKSRRWFRKSEDASEVREEALMAPSMSVPELGDMLKSLDESFSQMLLRKIDERGMTDAQCYKKANVDRKLFSKIRSNVQYKPSKPTAIAFAIALELDLRETEDLLRKAGYALSPSSKFDVIIEYFILRGNYNIFEINEALFYYDQSLLGA